MKLEPYQAFLEQRASQGLLRTLATPAQYELDFSSNDSLQLSAHPELIKASAKALNTFGTGTNSARLLATKQSMFAEIESELANLTGCESALLFNSGFIANSAGISALLNPQVLKGSAYAKASASLKLRRDKTARHPPSLRYGATGAAAVFCDRQIHASMHEGIRLAGSKQHRFRHQDLAGLEAQLKCKSDNYNFILVESLYGMTGTITNLDRLVSIAKEYDAFVYVDEAHAFGAYGHHGGGLSAGYAGIDCRMGNFGKALGGFGGFIACSQTIKDYFLNQANGFIYSTALPPAVLGACLAALQLLPKLQPQRNTLTDLSHYLLSQLIQCGIVTTPSKSHIIGIEFETVDAAKAKYLALLKDGIKTSLIRPPTAPKPMLRLSLHCNHRKSELDRLVNSLAK